MLSKVIGKYEYTVNEDGKLCLVISGDEDVIRDRVKRLMDKYETFCNEINSGWYLTDKD